MTTSPPPGRKDRLTPPPVILNDLACAHCAYDLKGLDSSGACPECGTPVVESWSRAQQAKSLRNLGPAGLLGVLWATFPGICGILLLANIGPASDWLRSHGSAGLAVYIVVFIVSAGLGFLPTFAQAILGGWVFGVAQGLPAALAGFGGGALIGYAVSRTVARRRVERLIEVNVKARAVRDTLIGRGPWRTFGLVALLRVPPNSPFALTNLIMASTGVPLLQFLLGTIVGMIPRTAIAVTMAAAAAQTGAKDIQAFVKSGPGPAYLIGGLVALVIALAIIGRLANKAVEKVARGGSRAA